MGQAAYWRYLLYRNLWTGLDWIFPPTCGGCGRPGTRWCADCQMRVIRPPDPLCDVCGAPQKTIGVCDGCKSSPPLYVALRSWAVFDQPVRQALHRLKYRRDMGLGEALAAAMRDHIQSLGWPVEIVTPVPLSRKRLAERGYNQVSMVALPLTLMCGWGYRPQALSRARETRSQVGLSREERRQNVRDAFVAQSSIVRDKTVLVIDDVTTTGATLESCTAALLKAGARQVFGYTVARALVRHGLKDV